MLARMEMLAPAPACCHSRIRVETQHSTQFIDITDRIDAIVADAGVRDGLVNVHTLHTTTAIVVNEHEPLLLQDFAVLLARTAPQHEPYRHDDMAARTVNLAPSERPNGHAHCRALPLGCSALLNLAGGRLQLGRWQRIFLVELDGPRTREISVLILGGGAQ
jgi:secondary thiamine-phosphate synthase enzyme